MTIRRDLRARGEEKQISETTNSTPQQKFNRFVNTFDELCDAALNWEDEEIFLNKLFPHSQRFRGHYVMFLMAAYPSDYEKPGHLPVSEVLMGRSRLGLMDIHNFFNPYVFEVRDSAIVSIQHL